MARLSRALLHTLLTSALVALWCAARAQGQAVGAEGSHTTRFLPSCIDTFQDFLPGFCIDLDGGV